MKIPQKDLDKAKLITKIQRLEKALVKAYAEYEELNKPKENK